MLEQQSRESRFGLGSLLTAVSIGRDRHAQSRRKGGRHRRRAIGTHHGRTEHLPADANAPERPFVEARIGGEGRGVLRNERQECLAELLRSAFVGFPRMTTDNDLLDCGARARRGRKLGPKIHELRIALSPLRRLFTDELFVNLGKSGDVAPRLGGGNRQLIAPPVRRAVGGHRFDFAVAWRNTRGAVRIARFRLILRPRHQDGNRDQHAGHHPYRAVSRHPAEELSAEGVAAVGVELLLHQRIGILEGEAPFFRGHPQAVPGLAVEPGFVADGRIHHFHKVGQRFIAGDPPQAELGRDFGKNLQDDGLGELVFFHSAGNDASLNLWADNGFFGRQVFPQALAELLHRGVFRLGGSAMQGTDRLLHLVIREP